MTHGHTAAVGPPPASIFGQFLLLPGCVPTPKVLVSCSLNTLKQTQENVLLKLNVTVTVINLKNECMKQ